MELDNKRFREESDQMHENEMNYMKRQYEGMEKAYIEAANSSQEMQKILSYNQIDFQKLLS